MIPTRVAGALPPNRPARTLVPASRSAEVVRRLRAHFLLKTIGMTSTITLFFVIYFHLLNHPVHSVTIMPLMAIDGIVPFLPWTLALYASLWVYVTLPPALLAEKRTLAGYLVATALLSTISFTVFYFWPTSIPRPEIDWAAHPGVAFLKTVDASDNACPSLHVAFSVFTAIWMHHLGRKLTFPRWAMLANLVWCAAIVYSTLSTKQHVAWDVIAGAALGAVVALVHLGVARRHHFD